MTDKPLKHTSSDLKRIENLVHKAFSMCDTDICGALKLIDKVFSGKNVPFLDYCVRESILLNYRLTRPTEKEVYEWFESNYKKHLGDEWEITKIKNNPKHIPDFWVANGVITIPVECKKIKFDAVALRQLERYMKHYRCSKGIAVARELTVKLPQNIKFIKAQIERSVKQ